MKDTSVGVPTRRGRRKLPVIWLVPLTALFTAPAYPPLEWHWAAWVGLAPLIWLLHHARGPLWFSIAAGWGYGAVFYALRYAWLPEALLVKGGLTYPVFFGIMIAATFLFALYPATVIAFCLWSHQRWGLSPGWSFPLLYSVQDALLGVTPFGGEPWGTLAATQTTFRVAEWLVPLAGGSFLVLVIASVNAYWFWAAIHWPLQRSRQILLALSGGMLAFLISLPAQGLAPEKVTGTDSKSAFRALLVPGNLPVNRLADPHASRETLRYFLQRTLAAPGASYPRGGPSVGEGPTPATEPAETPAIGEDQAIGEDPAMGTVELTIWPESAVSGRVEKGKLLDDLHGVAAALGSDFLFGSNARDLGRDFNSAYIVTGERFGISRYDKHNLVPFGEYVPEQIRWFFGKKLTEGIDDYHPGTGPSVLNWRGRRLGLSICFESILPGHVRSAVNEGADVLVAISNDQWLTAAAAAEHLNLTALRGMEVGREVLVAANGGWSGHLSAGRRTGMRYGDADALRVAVIPRSSLTPWTRWGYRVLVAAFLAYVAAIYLLRQLRLFSRPYSGEYFQTDR